MTFSVISKFGYMNEANASTREEAEVIADDLRSELIIENEHLMAGYGTDIAPVAMAKRVNDAWVWDDT